MERQWVRLLTTKGLSERRACLSLEVGRASIRYQVRPENEKNVRLRVEMRKLSMRHRRWGSPRMSGFFWKRYGYNHKRVERLWDQERLAIPRKKRRRLKGTPVWDRPQPATRPNEVWSFDFVFERTPYGRKLKMLVVIDEFTRECLEIRVEGRMRWQDVLETLDELIAERGAPTFTRTDNGSEFIAIELRKWLREKGITPIYIEPGSPWQNGFVESFNGKFRDECLDQEIFYSRGEAQVIVDWYRKSYNEERPHSSLGYLTPAEMAAGQGASPLGLSCWD